MLLPVSAKSFMLISSICAGYLCLFCQIPPFSTLQIAVRVHAIVVILFYGIFIGRFSISSFIVGVRHLPQPF